MPAAAILAQASAVWGSAALCEPGSAPSHEGKQTPHLVHPCPICWFEVIGAHGLATASGTAGEQDLIMVRRHTTSSTP